MPTRPPASLLRAGRDYLVVGRPVRHAPNRRDAAQRIIDELGDALATAAGGGRAPTTLAQATG